MIIDCAQWHYEEDFPHNLPQSQASTHIGMFLGWIIMNRLESDVLAEHLAEDLAKVRARTLSGRDFLLNLAEGQFLSDDLSPTGLAFTQAYYQDEAQEGYGQYMVDYYTALNVLKLPSLYHVLDSWHQYDLVAKHIDAAYAAWQQAQTEEVGHA
ncbi:MAG: hypothetical protein KBC57_12760 [Neisseriaceae bacterium]|nr:hypothetical protein [Neisseriaceae bacterium]MBP6863209.1 hypothetical protein [Neisseriaceae bacterium]